MYFDLTYYYYYTKLTFSPAALTKKQRCFLACIATEDANVEMGILASFDPHIFHFCFSFSEEKFDLSLVEAVADRKKRQKTRKKSF